MANILSSGGINLSLGQALISTKITVLSAESMKCMNIMWLQHSLSLTEVNHYLGELK